MPRQTKIEKLIEQATIDCYDNNECLSGFYTMIQDNLPFPFTATIAGEAVQVTKTDLTNTRIVALCKRNRKQHRIDILDIKIDKSIKGREWIEAYRAWLCEN